MVRALARSSLLAALLVSLSLAPTAWSSRAQGQTATWSRLPVTAGVHYHSVIRDAARDRLLAFGGMSSGINSNETFEFALSGPPAWRLVDPGTGPRPDARNGQSAIYDPVRGRMLVFGGNTSTGTRNDLWALSLSGTPTWAPLVAAGTPPPARWGQTAVYDPVRDRMLMVGGNTGSIKLNDVWELSLAGTPTWTALAPTGAPPGVRWGHSGVYDPVNDRVVIFGGINVSSPYNDVWALSFGGSPAWTNLAPSGAPPSARWVHAAEYDPVRERMLVFGGYDGTNNLNESWQLSLQGTPTWSPLATTGDPPAARWGMPWVFDAPRDRLVVFGGSVATGDIDDLWTLSLAGGAQWQLQLEAATRAPWRYEHPAVFDPIGRRMYVIGGFNGGFLNDVQAFELEGAPRWTTISPLGTRPVGLHSHTATYDPLRNRIIVIGGISSSAGTTFNEVWELSLTAPQAWSRLAPTGAPPSDVYAHTAIHDPVHDRLVCYGGSLYDAGSTSPVWTLSLAGGGSWAPLVAGGTSPGRRSGHTAIYDPVRNRMVICAGYGEFGNPYTEMWALSLGDAPTWTQLPFVNNFFRSNPTAVYDQVADQMLLFGGYNVATIAMNDAWTVPLAATGGIAPLSVSGSLPLGRANHSAIFDPVSRRMLVFGGFSAGTLNAGTPGRDDVHALQLPGNVSAPPLPTGTSLRLAPAYPDPAQDHVTIEFALPAASHATLRVYDVTGRLVRTLVDGALDGGSHRVIWDRRNASGRPADAGLYFYELRTARERLTGRVALLR